MATKKNKATARGLWPRIEAAFAAQTEKLTQTEALTRSVAAQTEKLTQAVEAQSEKLTQTDERVGGLGILWEETQQHLRVLADGHVALLETLDRRLAAELDPIRHDIAAMKVVLEHHSRLHEGHRRDFERLNTKLDRKADVERVEALERKLL
ncbi:MAG: hypothetical protein IPJ65_01280 [Archangiaceae bacterium]|nr:hypothetical protein [Archangiaceae bacterium]